QFVVRHTTLGQGPTNSKLGIVGLREVLLEHGTHELVTRIAGHAAHLLVEVCDKPLWVNRDKAVSGGFDQPSEVSLLFAHLLLEANSIRDVTDRGENAARSAARVLENRRVEGHLQVAAGPRDKGEGVLGDHTVLEGLLDTGASNFALREVIG